MVKGAVPIFPGFKCNGLLAGFLKYLILDEEWFFHWSRTNLGVNIAWVLLTGHCSWSVAHGVLLTGYYARGIARGILLAEATESTEDFLIHLQMGIDFCFYQL